MEQLVNMRLISGTGLLQTGNVSTIVKFGGDSLESHNTFLLLVERYLELV